MAGKLCFYEQSSVIETGELCHGSRLEIDGSVNELSMCVAHTIEMDADALDIIKRSIAVYVFHTKNFFILEDIMNLIDHLESQK